MPKTTSTQPEVTIAIVPRDHFCHARTSLEHLYARTPEPFRLIYVLHSAPPDVEAFVVAESRRRGFELIRSERPLTPNESRNLALRRVETPFVLFLDNDTIPLEGWLGALLDAAKREDAAIVGPTYLEGPPGEGLIHMAGGILRIEALAEGRRIYERHCHLEQRLADVAHQLRSGPTDFQEFHCMLVRTELFDRIGPLDEALQSQCEHLDVCLAASRAGGLVYHEVASRVSFLKVPPIPTAELPYYLLRWSEAWNEASVRHFLRKWDLEGDRQHLEHIMEWSRNYRREVLGALAWPLGRLGELTLYRAGTRRLGAELVARIERHAVAPLIRRRARLQAA